MQAEKIILGIDPGTSVMGFGIISVYKGKMKLIAIDELVMKKEPNHETKLKRIFDKTLALIDEFHPDEVALSTIFREECAIYAQTRTSTRCGNGCKSSS